MANWPSPSGDFQNSKRPFLKQNRWTGPEEHPSIPSGLHKHPPPTHTRVHWRLHTQVHIRTYTSSCDCRIHTKFEIHGPEESGFVVPHPPSCKRREKLSSKRNFYTEAEEVRGWCTSACVAPFTFCFLRDNTDTLQNTSFMLISMEESHDDTCFSKILV